MAVVREERADAARNRKAILEAADELFATSDSRARCRWTTSPAPRSRQGTLFRRFGDRAT